jgi:membrane protein
MIRIFFKHIGDLIGETIQKAIRDDIITQGAAIAFYTIFSIAPLFILIVALGNIFLSEETVVAEVQGYLTDFLDPSTLDSLASFFEDRTNTGGSFITTVIALITVVFGATTVISQLKVSLNRIWNVSDIKIHSVWNFLLNRLLSFGMIILFSLLLISSLLAEAAVAVIAEFFAGLLPAFELSIFRFAARFGTLGFSISFFMLIFKILPDVNARWKDIFVGSVVTTALFMIGKYLIGFYFTSTGIEATYRAAGSLVIFVVWVYYNIQTILLGAVFTQVYTEKYGGRILPYRFVSLANFRDPETITKPGNPDVKELNEDQ